MDKKIAVIGGDLRHAILARLLADDGCTVSVYGLSHDGEYGTMNEIKELDEISRCDAVILPMPVTSDGEHINAPIHESDIKIDDIMKYVSTNTIVLGGKLPPDIIRRYKNLSFYDYLEREEFAVKNAVATAEGAVALAINETPFTLWRSRCLVTGYGRIAKILINMLKAMGADVDAAARKCADRAWIETHGCSAVDTAKIDKYIGKYDLVFNTVPHRIFDKKVLDEVKSGALIIDLASKPGGVDFESAKDMGKNVIWALSLPGKVAPYTSGEILKDTIVNIFDELNKSQNRKE